MGITEWVAVLVIFAVVYCLIKRYETRLVLIGSGLLLCLISWNLVGGLNAFAKSMTNASLVMAICGSMGFAFVAKYTEADRSLVHYLSAPIRGLGIFLVPVCTAITFFVNIAIPSAAGCPGARRPGPAARTERTVAAPIRIRENMQNRANIVSKITDFFGKKCDTGA